MNDPTIFLEIFDPLSQILLNRIMDKVHLLADHPSPKVSDVIYGNPLINYVSPGNQLVST